MFGNEYNLTRQALLYGVLFFCYFLMAVFLIYWYVWNESVQQQQELERFQEENNTLMRELQQKRRELKYMQEHIRELEELMSQRLSMYRTVKLENRGENMDLTLPSGFTAEMLEKSFSRYAGGALQGSGEEFVALEEEYGINAVAAAAISVNETGWGRSRLVREKNNYFGWSAYDHAPYKSALEFTSREHSIEYVGSRIKEKYLQPEGPYYHGPTLEGMNVRYASDDNWSQKVAAAMKKIIAYAIPPEEAAYYAAHLFSRKQHSMETAY